MEGTGKKGGGKTYGDHVVFKNASLTIERGDKVAFVGKNGELLLDLMYEYDKYSVLLQGRGVFDQANGRGENRFANNNYWVWNASLNYKLQKNTRLYVKVNNIFNQFYSNWDNESGGFLGFDEWYAEPGRNYQIGINYSF